MRTRTQRLAIALAFDDIGFCPHRARYNTKLTLESRNCSFTGDIHVLTVVMFLADIIVMAINSLFRQRKMR